MTCLDDEDSFLILTGGGSELHDLRRLQDIARQRHLEVDLENVSEDYGVLTIVGPESRNVMKQICDQVI